MAPIAPEIVEGQFWERDGRCVRVTWLPNGPNGIVNYRDLETGRIAHLSGEHFAAAFTLVGSPLSDYALLFRLSDLVRRAGVSDAVHLVDSLESLVRKRSRGETDANADHHANSGSS